MRRSTDQGRTWSERENVDDQLDVLRRPFLTRLDEQTILLSGRGRPRQTVAYLSRDNGRTFGERFVLAWPSDEGERKSHPDINVATLCVSDDSP